MLRSYFHFKSHNNEVTHQKQIQKNIIEISEKPNHQTFKGHFHQPFLHQSLSLLLEWIKKWF